MKSKHLSIGMKISLTVCIISIFLVIIYFITWRAVIDKGIDYREWIKIVGWGTTFFILPLSFLSFNIATLIKVIREVPATAAKVFSSLGIGILGLFCMADIVLCNYLFLSIGNSLFWKEERIAENVIRESKKVYLETTDEIMIRYSKPVTLFFKAPYNSYEEPEARVILEEER